MPIMSPTPPPPAAEPPALSLDQLMAAPVMLGGQTVPGIGSMTLGDLELDVLKGGRFVTFAWNVSVVVLSFRNSTKLLYVPSHGKTGGHALGWGVFSLLFGWWGFPWGLIYTPMSLWQNASGGADHTHAVLAALLGDEHAAEIMRQTRPRKPDAMLRALRGLLLAFAALIAWGLFSLFTAV